jgi:hypothetical protein
VHLPSKTDDLIVALRSSLCPAFDNPTNDLASETADILCEASTGGRYIGRTLYTQGGLSRLKFQPKLILLASTSQLVQRIDLGSRAIALEVHPTPHLPDDVIEREVEFIIAGVLTKLLDGAVMELRNRNRDYPDVHGRLNRFERNARRRAEAFGWDDAEIAALLRRSQRDLQADIAENDIVPGVMVPLLLQKFKVQDEGSILGETKPLTTTATDLWTEAVNDSPALRLRDSGFPTNPPALARRLRDLVDQFAAVGIRITFPPRSSQMRRILISREQPAGASAHPPGPNQATEPPARCPTCSGEAWWCAEETQGEWRCQPCVEMPMVVHYLRQWTGPRSTRH